MKKKRKPKDNRILKGNDLTDLLKFTREVIERYREDIKKK